MVSPAVVAAMGSLGIGLGAFGAHGLKGRVDPALSEPPHNVALQPLADD